MRRDGGPAGREAFGRTLGQGICRRPGVLPGAYFTLGSLKPLSTTPWIWTRSQSRTGPLEEQWHLQSPHLFLAVVASLLKARAHGQVCAVTKGARLGQIPVQARGKWDLAQEGLVLPGAVLSCHGLRLIASFSGTLRGAYSCSAHLTLGLSHRPVCGPSLLLALPFLRELEVLRATQCSASC